MVRRKQEASRTPFSVPLLSLWYGGCTEIVMECEAVADEEGRRGRVREVEAAMGSKRWRLMVVSDFVRFRNKGKKSRQTPCAPYLIVFHGRDRLAAER